jgi:hypothetical protein
VASEVVEYYSAKDKAWELTTICETVIENGKMKKYKVGSRNGWISDSSKLRPATDRNAEDRRDRAFAQQGLGKLMST